MIQAHVHRAVVICPANYVDFFPKCVPFIIFSINFLSHLNQFRVFHRRQRSISFAKGFSHVYILIIRIPDSISFMVRILWSVRRAVLILSRENIFPIHPVKQILGYLYYISQFMRLFTQMIDLLLILYHRDNTQPCKGTTSSRTKNPAKHEGPISW